MSLFPSIRVHVNEVACLGPHISGNNAAKTLIFVCTLTSILCLGICFTGCLEGAKHTFKNS